MPQTVTRRFIMQKARRHPLPRRAIGLRQIVGIWFQVLFTPLKGVLFTVQSPYWYAIGRDGVLSLGGWAPQLHTEFHELRATLVRHNHASQRLRDFHPVSSAFPDCLAIATRSISGARNPCRQADRFGLFRVRSPLLTESRLISLPAGT